MAARRKARRNRMPAGLRRYWAKHRRRAKTNAVGPKVNRRRRRARHNYTFAGNKRRRARRNYTFRANRRRSYRRNPAILGFQIPPMMDIAGVIAGLYVPPMVGQFVMAQLPADLQANKFVAYGVKAASVLVPSMIVRRFLNPRIGNLMLLVGFGSFVLDVIRLETGFLAGQPLLGFYPTLSRRGGLGTYLSMPTRSKATRFPAMIQGAPSRLSPQERF